MSRKWGKEILQTALDELAAVGITPRKTNGGKHIRLFWEHNGQERNMTIPISPSDYRAAENSRSQIRRILRADGLLKEEEEATATVENLPARYTPNLALENGKVLASSLDVATHFGKSHKDVLRSIDRLLGELDTVFSERNFTPSTYLDGSGKANRCFKLTRDGLSLLAMGFTGTTAIKWKQAYIEAFNHMEAEIFKLAVPDSVMNKLRSLESDIAALVDLLADMQRQALPAPKSRLKPLPRWVKRQYERKIHRKSAA